MSTRFCYVLLVCNVLFLTLQTYNDICGAVHASVPEFYVRLSTLS